MTSIVNNILYIIDALEQFNSLIKLSIFVVVFFSFGKISCKTFKFENKSILKKKKKNYQVLKTYQDQHNTFSNYHNLVKLAFFHTYLG